jgi:hypothetical protein
VNDLRFEELSKELSTTHTRRRAVKLFGATAAGGFMTLIGAGKASADARCYQGGHGCRENSECCSNFCDPFSATCACSPGTFECPPTGICVGPCGTGQSFNPATCACECPTGTQACGQSCCAEEPTQTCVSGNCCTNPITCTTSSDCCRGYMCRGGIKGEPRVCVQCINPTTCSTNEPCCAGFVCAVGGVCIPA